MNTKEINEKILNNSLTDSEIDSFTEVVSARLDQEFYTELWPTFCKVYEWASKEKKEDLLLSALQPMAMNFDHAWKILMENAKEDFIN